MESIYKLLLEKAPLPVMIIIGIFCVYRLFVVLWDIRQKRAEIKDEMDDYVNNLIDAKTSPLNSKLELVNHRINDLDKLRLPIKLIAIETKLEVLTSNVDAGFKRIEEDIRSFHRK